MSESKTRRTRRSDASESANIKLRTSTLGSGSGSLVDKFRNAVNEKSDRQAYRDALDVAYKRQSDKKKIEMEKFKSEMAKMLEDDSEEEERLRVERRKNKSGSVVKKPGKLKGNWEKKAQEQQEAEQQKLDRERKRRERQDRIEKKKAKKELEEKGEDADEHSKILVGQKSTMRKPTKIKTNFMEIAQASEEQTKRKIAMERFSRIKTEQEQMMNEKQGWEESLQEQWEEKNNRIKKEKIDVGRLNIDFTRQEKERQAEYEAELKKVRSERLMKETTDMNNQYVSESESEPDDNVRSNKPTPKKLGKINFLNELTETEKLEQELAKISDEKHGLQKLVEQINADIKKMQEVKPRDFPDEETYNLYLENMADRVDELSERKNLIQENIFQLNCEEKMIMREIKELFEEQGIEKVKRGKSMGKDKLSFDQMEIERRKKEEQAIYDERLKLLQAERAALGKAQAAYRAAHEDQDFDEKNDFGASSIAPKKLDTKLSMFDAVQHQRQLEEKNDLLKKKMKALEEEMEEFKRQQEDGEEEDAEVKTTQGVNVERNYRPGKVNTLFDAHAREELEKQSYALRAEKEKLLEEEIKLMKMASSNMGEDDVNVAHSSNIEPICQDDILLRRPKKINRKLFENVDLEAQRMIEQQRIKAERDARLAEEQAMFAAQKQDNLHPDFAYTGESEIDRSAQKSVKKPKKINADSYLQKLQQQQAEAEQERLMEKKFERMTFEQQEMIVQHEKDQENAKYYLSDDDRQSESDYSDEDEDFTPIFMTEVQPKVEVMEGHSVTFSCVINSKPKPHITWYFNRRPIRDTEDYQYHQNGNSYSLFMNETFLDDSGEYICKAENRKGAATSVSILQVEEDPDLED